MKNSNHKKVLIVDTSTTWAYLGYAETEKKEIVNFRQNLFQPEKEKTDWLSASLTEFLAPLKLTDIDKIVIGKGPGSFTGLRISFSYFRTAAMLLDIPISTFASGVLWHLAICSNKETLLTQLNKNLYTAYDPLNKIQGIKQPGEWIDFFKNNPKEKGIIWDTAYLNQKTSLNWPENCTVYNNKPGQNKIMPAFDFIFQEAGNWEEALPEYGHTMKLTKKGEN